MNPPAELTPEPEAYAITWVTEVTETRTRVFTATELAEAGYPHPLTSDISDFADQELPGYEDGSETLESADVSERFITRVEPAAVPAMPPMTADGADVPVTGSGVIPEPIPGDERNSLKDELDNTLAALDGDSNDAEHDALYSVAQVLARVLGVDIDI